MLGAGVGATGSGSGAGSVNRTTTAAPLLAADTAIDSKRSSSAASATTSRDGRAAIDTSTPCGLALVTLEVIPPCHSSIAARPSAIDTDARGPALYSTRRYRAA